MELKGSDVLNVMAEDIEVPNLPCGVESELSNSTTKTSELVPNLPCGVESLKHRQVL